MGNPARLLMSATAWPYPVLPHNLDSSPDMCWSPLRCVPALTCRSVATSHCSIPPPHAAGTITSVRTMSRFDQSTEPGFLLFTVNSNVEDYATCFSG